MAAKGRRRFSREFKLEAVKLASQEGVAISQIARDLGIVDTVLRRWKQQYDSKGQHAFGGSGHIAPKDEELVQLKRELARVKRERDFLKNAAVFFAKESE